MSMEYFNSWKESRFENARAVGFIVGVGRQWHVETETCGGLIGLVRIESREQLRAVRYRKETPERQRVEESKSALYIDYRLLQSPPSQSPMSTQVGRPTGARSADPTCPT